MSLVPGWAPNLHPLIIHFPIALLIAAAMVDLVDALFERPAWLGVGATSLYLVGAGLRISHIRLEPAPRTETSPSAILKFDLLNEAADSPIDS